MDWKTKNNLETKQCSPEAPATGVFAGYSYIKRRLLLSVKSIKNMIIKRKVFKK